MGGLPRKVLLDEYLNEKIQANCMPRVFRSKKTETKGVILALHGYGVSSAVFWRENNDEQHKIFWQNNPITVMFELKIKNKSNTYSMLKTIMRNMGHL